MKQTNKSIVRKLIKEGHTQTEITRITGLDQKQISNAISRGFLEKDPEPGHFLMTAGTIYKGHKDQPYYESEDEIRQALEPLYTPEGLTGWELEQFNQNTNE